MFVLKNAWRSVVRGKGRNALIVVVVAIIAAAATIGLAIRNAAETARAEGLASTSVTATIGVDREAMMASASESATGSSGEGSDSGKPDVDAMRAALDRDALTLADYRKYAKASSVLVDTYYTETTSVNATDGFQPVESTTSNTAGASESPSGDSGDSVGFGMEGGRNGGGMDSGDFSLVGFSSDAAVAAASNGSFTMSEGQVFGYDSSSDGDVIIPKALADFNGISVGDVITVADLSSDDAVYRLTVVGVYKNDSTANTGMNGPMGGTSSDPDNAIYTSVSTLEHLELSAGDGSSDTTDDSDASGDSTATATSQSRTQLAFTYVLDGKDAYETFARDVEQAGLADGYAVSSTDVDQYEASLVPLDNLSDFALTLLVIVLAVGAVVLVVINLFNIRERRYEVGVLLAIGIRKSKVAAQFVIELLIVTMIGIALGVAGGTVASVPVSDQLLAQQVASQQSQASDARERFGRDTDMSGAPGAPGTSAGAGGTDTGGAASDASDTPESNGSEGVFAPSQTSNAFERAADYVTDIDATVDLAVVARLILIGLALTIVSALAGIIAIIRYEPLQILADRS